MEYLLDKIIIPSLEIEFVTKFKAFLEVMENDDDGLFKGMARTLGMYLMYCNITVPKLDACEYIPTSVNTFSTRCS